jgi:hypothetical protein
VRGLIAKVTVALSLVASVGITTAVASSASSDSRPSLQSLESLIKTAVTIHQAPNLSTTIPALSTMTPRDVVIQHMRYRCYSDGFNPKIPTDVQISCAWGDVGAKRSILLWGDEQAAMWLPAFDRFGLDHGWKILFLGKPNCPPWINPNQKTYTGASRVGCNSFVSSVIKFANASHPSYIVPVGMGGDYGLGHWPTKSEMTSEVLATYNALAPSTGHIVFLDQIPWFEKWFTSATPTTCLKQHSTDVTKCLVKPFIDTNVVRIGVANVSHQKNRPVVPVRQLFCTSRACALFVRSPEGFRLVYYNQFLINRYYSVWISKALGSLLAPFLPA